MNAVQTSHKLDGKKIIVKSNKSIIHPENWTPEMKVDFNESIVGEEVEIFRAGTSGLILLCSILIKEVGTVYFSIDARDTNCDKTIYIAGPITGIENENRHSFQKAEFFLLSQGYLPINPHSILHKEASAMIEANKLAGKEVFSHDEIWSAYLKEDIKEGQTCNSVFLLDGFENSKGANLECVTFERYGKNFFVLENDMIKKVNLNIELKVEVQQ